MNRRRPPFDHAEQKSPSKPHQMEDHNDQERVYHGAQMLICREKRYIQRQKHVVGAGIRFIEPKARDEHRRKNADGDPDIPVARPHPMDDEHVDCAEDGDQMLAEILVIPEIGTRFSTLS